MNSDIAYTITECKVCQEKYQCNLEEHCNSIFFQKTRSSMFQVKESYSLHDNQNLILCTKCNEDNGNIMKFHFENHLNLVFIGEPLSQSKVKQESFAVKLACDEKGTRATMHTQTELNFQSIRSENRKSLQLNYLK